MNQYPLSCSMHPTTRTRDITNHFLGIAYYRYSQCEPIKTQVSDFVALIKWYFNLVIWAPFDDRNNNSKANQTRITEFCNGHTHSLNTYICSRVYIQSKLIQKTSKHERPLLGLLYKYIHYATYSRIHLFPLTSTLTTPMCSSYTFDKFVI